MEMQQTHCYPTVTVTLLWKRHKLFATQQQLSHHYGNAIKDLICHVMNSAVAITLLKQETGEFQNTQKYTRFFLEASNTESLILNLHHLTSCQSVSNSRYIFCKCS
jgi:hypothetical protein